MLRKAKFIVLLLTIGLPAQAQVFESDSLALVALYDSTDGANWTNTWDLNTPVDTWHRVRVSGGRVTQLSLYSNQLSGTIPTELGNLNILKYLYLDRNKLTGSIPVELCSLTNLGDLSLGSNYLAGSIPAELENLGNLIDLGLAGNRFTGFIPAELGNLVNLASLNVGLNRLTGSVPPELGNLANLTYSLSS